MGDSDIDSRIGQINYELENLDKDVEPPSDITVEKMVEIKEL